MVHLIALVLSFLCSANAQNLPPKGLSENAAWILVQGDTRTSNPNGHPKINAQSVTIEKLAHPRMPGMRVSLEVEEDSQIASAQGSLRVSRTGRNGQIQHIDLKTAERFPFLEVTSLLPLPKISQSDMHFAVKDKLGQTWNIARYPLFGSSNPKLDAKKLEDVIFKLNPQLANTPQTYFRLIFYVEFISEPLEGEVEPEWFEIIDDEGNKSSFHFGDRVLERFLRQTTVDIRDGIENPGDPKLSSGTTYLKDMKNLEIQFSIEHAFAEGVSASISYVNENGDHIYNLDPVSLRPLSKCSEGICSAWVGMDPESWENGNYYLDEIELRDAFGNTSRYVFSSYDSPVHFEHSSGQVRKIIPFSPKISSAKLILLSTDDLFFNIQAEFTLEGPGAEAANSAYVFVHSPLDTGGGNGKAVCANQHCRAEIFVSKTRAYQGNYYLASASPSTPENQYVIRSFDVENSPAKIFLPGHLDKTPPALNEDSLQLSFHKAEEAQAYFFLEFEIKMDATDAWAETFAFIAGPNGAVIAYGNSRCKDSKCEIRFPVTSNMLLSGKYSLESLRVSDSNFNSRKWTYELTALKHAQVVLP